jgi:hypothetical protein
MYASGGTPSLRARASSVAAERFWKNSRGVLAIRLRKSEARFWAPTAARTGADVFFLVETCWTDARGLAFFDAALAGT